MHFVVMLFHFHLVGRHAHLSGTDTCRCFPFPLAAGSDRLVDHRRTGAAWPLQRTLMQSAGLLASGGAGLLLPVLGMLAMIVLSAVLVGVPGVFGAGVKQLRLQGT